MVLSSPGRTGELVLGVELRLLPESSRLRRTPTLTKRVLAGLERTAGMVGEEVYEAGRQLRPQASVHPPRFLERGPELARVVEIISPAGFERYFEELAEILSVGGPPDVPGIEALAARYG